MSWASQMPKGSYGMQELDGPGSIMSTSCHASHRRVLWDSSSFFLRALCHLATLQVGYNFTHETHITMAFDVCVCRQAIVYVSNVYTGAEGCRAVLTMPARN